VVDWCTKIPLDTPLARLVTTNPAVDVIERDSARLHMWNWLNLMTAGWLPAREPEDFAETFAAMDRKARLFDCAGMTTVGRSSAAIYFFRDGAVDRTDRASKESVPPPLLRMKRSSALTRGIFKRSMGTIALIQRSGTGKSGSGTTREPLRISGSAT